MTAAALRSPFPAYPTDHPAMPDDSSNVVPFTPRQSWCILRVQPQQERWVAETLRTEKGVNAYCPLHKSKPKHATIRGAVRTRPLMRGYVFADLPNDEAIDAARNLRNVSSIMCLDGRPRRIPSLAIGCLIFLEACNAFDETWEPPLLKDGPRYTYRWRKGERVRIRGGAFAGFVAEVDGGHGRDHMTVLLSIFGRVTEIVVEHKDLEKPD